MERGDIAMDSEIANSDRFATKSEASELLVKGVGVAARSGHVGGEKGER
jgi:hypothetical protein